MGLLGLGLNASSALTCEPLTKTNCWTIPSSVSHFLVEEDLVETTYRCVVPGNN